MCGGAAAAVLELAGSTAIAALLCAAGGRTKAGSAAAAALSGAAPALACNSFVCSRICVHSSRRSLHRLLWPAFAPPSHARQLAVGVYSAPTKFNSLTFVAHGSQIIWSKTVRSHRSCSSAILRTALALYTPSGQPSR